MNEARSALRADDADVKIGPVSRTNPPGAPTRSKATIVARPRANVATAKIANPSIRLERLLGKGIGELRAGGQFGWRVFASWHALAARPADRVNPSAGVSQSDAWGGPAEERRQRPFPMPRPRPALLRKSMKLLRRRRRPLTGINVDGVDATGPAKVAFPAEGRFQRHREDRPSSFVVMARPLRLNTFIIGALSERTSAKNSVRPASRPIAARRPPARCPGPSGGASITGESHFGPSRPDNDSGDPPIMTWPAVLDRLATRTTWLMKSMSRKKCFSSSDAFATKKR